MEVAGLVIVTFGVLPLAKECLQLVNKHIGPSKHNTTELECLSGWLDDIIQTIAILKMRYEGTGTWFLESFTLHENVQELLDHKSIAASLAGIGPCDEASLLHLVAALGIHIAVTPLVSENKDAETQRCITRSYMASKVRFDSYLRMEHHQKDSRANGIRTTTGSPRPHHL
ncbi:uncharacterized protein CCOS01_14684 [Colletotrichum costaricense]|uniref:Uncharacterized protein n=1 Tax=Colletotrichum costaricense TaxID=1209916 RepID=A0AAI9YJ33_9PEZI|nr:uncharacterized protein CCOS01_14684 [Colletotrichum costaricense]KAK1512444.1 hypothetical protein CCOS01_14684 [Colletotrichum costaricense]